MTPRHRAVRTPLTVRLAPLGRRTFALAAVVATLLAAIACQPAADASHRSPHPAPSGPVPSPSPQAPPTPRPTLLGGTVTSDPPDAVVFGLLHLLRFEPTRLDAAPVDELAQAIEHRLVETHPCLNCGRLAERAYVVPTKLYGNRWLDLCVDCDTVLRRMLGTHPIERAGGAL